MHLIVVKGGVITPFHFTLLMNKKITHHFDDIFYGW